MPQIDDIPVGQYAKHLVILVYDRNCPEVVARKHFVRFLERVFRVHRYGPLEWAVRLTAVNVTGHRNYDFVNNNIDAPNYLTFAGGHARAFSARIRLIK